MRRSRWKLHPHGCQGGGGRCEAKHKEEASQAFVRDRHTRFSVQDDFAIQMALIACVLMVIALTSWSGVASWQIGPCNTHSCAETACRDGAWGEWQELAAPGGLF